MCVASRIGAKRRRQRKDTICRGGNAASSAGMRVYHGRERRMNAWHHTKGIQERLKRTYETCSQSIPVSSLPLCCCQYNHIHPPTHSSTTTPRPKHVARPAPAPRSGGRTAHNMCLGPHASTEDDYGRARRPASPGPDEQGKTGRPPLTTPHSDPIASTGANRRARAGA